MKVLTRLSTLFFGTVPSAHRPGCPPSRPPRDALSPQRGEGRSEGRDRLAASRCAASNQLLLLPRLGRGTERDQAAALSCQHRELQKRGSVPGPCGLKSAFRVMESCLGLSIVLTDHEPFSTKLCLIRDKVLQVARGRFMGSPPGRRGGCREVRGRAARQQGCEDRSPRREPAARSISALSFSAR